jgi:hypothetical protein
MSARFLTRRSLSPLIGGLPTPARSGMAVRRGLQHLVGARVSQNWSPKKVEPSGFRDRRHRVEQILDVANAAVRPKSLSSEQGDAKGGRRVAEFVIQAGKRKAAPLREFQVSSVIHGEPKAVGNAERFAPGV